MQRARHGPGEGGGGAWWRRGSARGGLARAARAVTTGRRRSAAAALAAAFGAPKQRSARRGRRCHCDRRRNRRRDCRRERRRRTTSRPPPTRPRSTAPRTEARPGPAAGLAWRAASAARSERRPRRHARCGADGCAGPPQPGGDAALPLSRGDAGVSGSAAGSRRGREGADRARSRRPDGVDEGKSRAGPRRELPPGLRNREAPGSRPTREWRPGRRPRGVETRTLRTPWSIYLPTHPW